MVERSLRAASRRRPSRRCRRARSARLGGEVARRARRARRSAATLRRTAGAASRRTGDLDRASPDRFGRKGEFEVGTSIREALEVAGLARRALSEILPSTNNRASYARRVPLRVVGLVTPWNSPLILALRAALPALVLGNAVVFEAGHADTGVGGPSHCSAVRRCETA